MCSVHDLLYKPRRAQHRAKSPGRDECISVEEDIYPSQAMRGETRSRGRDITARLGMQVADLEVVKPRGPVAKVTGGYVWIRHPSGMVIECRVNSIHSHVHCTCQI